MLGRLTAEHRARLELVWADGKYRNHRLDRWMARPEVGYRIDSALPVPPEDVLTGSIGVTCAWPCASKLTW